jgi:hypothetical protein
MTRRISKPRSTSKLVATKPACAPLLRMYRAAESARPRAWSEVEDHFVRAMEQFDANVTSGTADQGDRQNGKGDFLNDLIALLLENCAGVKLVPRLGMPGFVFPSHNLDVTYPPSGDVRFAMEVKAAGTPRHPRSPAQEPVGRPGSADLPKRIKEAAFKTIDLKAAYGQMMSAHGRAASAPSGNLTSWLRSVPPKAYLFMSVRVVGPADFDATVALANMATQVMDGVGLFCFGPTSESHPTTYRILGVPRHLGFNQVLYRACEDLVAIGNQTPQPASVPAIGPAADAEAALREVNREEEAESEDRS